MTIEAWVYPTASGSIRVLAGRPAGYQLDLLPDRHVRWAIVQGGQVAPWVDSTSLLPLDSWTHVVGTYDAATGELKVYLNGAHEKGSGLHTRRGQVLTLTIDAPTVTREGVRS